MSKIDDLAKNGTYFRPLATTPAQAQEEDGDFMRGLKKAGHQIPQTVGGSVALVGDLVGSDGMREYGMDVYNKRAEQIDAISKPSDSLSTVLEGEGDAVDWAQNTAGYVAGQVGTALLTGGAGGFIGKALAKRGIASIIERGVQSKMAREVGEKVMASGAKAGALTGVMGLNLTQEAGSIYPDAVHHADAEGRELTGSDKARVVGSAITAAGVDTAMDMLMLGKVMAGGRRAGEGMAKAAVREVPLAMAREGVTEGIQTGIERYGAGKELNTAEAVREYVDSVGVGLFGGGAGGALSVLHAQKVPDAGPLSRAANTAVDQEILQLTHDPDPIIVFPDGSAGHRADFEAYLKQFPEENGKRNEARAKLLGLDAKTGEPIEPEPAPEPEFAATPEEQQEKLTAWAAEHEPATLEYAHSLLAAPGMKGKNMMVAPHPDGGYTVVPSNWLTLDTQATLGALQKPAPAAKEEAAPEPAPAPAAPAEPEWKTNPYTAYKFADRELAINFMTNKKVDTALFEARPQGDLFVIKKKPEGATNDSGLAPVHQDGAAGRDGGSGTVAGPASDDAVGTGPADAAVEQQPAAVGEPEQAAEPDPVHATGSANAEPALKASILAELEQAGTTRAQVLTYRLDRARENLSTLKAHPHLNKRDQAEEVAKLEQEIKALNSVEKQARDLDMKDERDHMTRSMLSGAKQEIDAAVRAGAMTKQQADEAVEQARVTGNVVDAVGTIYEKVDQHAPGAQGAAQVTGEPIDNEWSAFATESGTLNIDRADMPQVKAEHRGAMVNFLNARGIAHQQEEVPAASLKPTQREFSHAKVEQAKAYEGGERSILISADNHVLDGHHQWLAKLDANEPVNVIRLAAPIADLIEQVKEFPSAQLAEGASAAPAEPEQGAAPAQPAAEPDRDTGTDIPKAFYKKVKVAHDVHVEETGATETIEIPADQALKSVREDIANLKALLKCMKG